MKDEFLLALGRDETVSLFRTLGKVLRSKREGDDANESALKIAEAASARSHQVIAF